MSFELVFTSVPKGLKPGSRGFASVAYTRGMPANYVDLCESLSGYVHVFGPEDDRYGLNPVAISHLLAHVGGKTLSIVSRVASCGLDYTGRTNKCAHHVMLLPEERPLHAGPASSLKEANLFYTKWEADPAFLAPNRVELEAIAGDDYRAGSWEALLGDAGYAGLLAQSFLDKQERPSFIIYEPGVDVLPLIAEAQVLLPRDRQWELTFTTYFMALPVGMKCAWRCCLPNSDALVLARRTPGALVIDLTKRRVTIGNEQVSKPDSANPLVELARTGRVKESSISPTMVEQSTGSVGGPPPPPPSPAGAKQRRKQRTIKINQGTNNFADQKTSPVPSRKPLSLGLITILILLGLMCAVWVVTWYIGRRAATKIPDAVVVVEAERPQVSAGEAQISSETLPPSEAGPAAPGDKAIMPDSSNALAIATTSVVQNVAKHALARALSWYDQSAARGELVAYYERDNVFSRSNLIETASPEGGVLFRSSAGDNEPMLRQNRLGVWECLKPEEAWALELRDNDKQVLYVLSNSNRAFAATTLSDEEGGGYVITLRGGSQYWKAMTHYLEAIDSSRLRARIGRHPALNDQRVSYTADSKAGRFRIQISSEVMKKDKAEVEGSEKEIERVNDLLGKLVELTNVCEALKQRYSEMKEKAKNAKMTNRGIAGEDYSDIVTGLEKLLAAAESAGVDTNKIALSRRYLVSFNQKGGGNLRTTGDGLEEVFGSVDRWISDVIPNIEKGARRKAAGEKSLKEIKDSQAVWQFEILLDSRRFLVGRRDAK